MSRRNASPEENTVDALLMGSGHTKAKDKNEPPSSKSDNVVIPTATQDTADATPPEMAPSQVTSRTIMMSPQEDINGEDASATATASTSVMATASASASTLVDVPDEVASPVSTPLRRVWSPEVMEPEEDYDVMDVRVTAKTPDVTAVSAMTRADARTPSATDLVVRDVEFMRWEDEDEEEFPLRWSTAAADRSMRRRFLCDVCRVRDTPSLQRMVTSSWDVNETLRQTRETFTSFGSVVLHDSFTALHQTARESWLEGARILLDGGAHIDSFDFRDAQDRGYCYTPLMHAAANGDEPLARHLVARGADVNARDPMTRNSALLLAAVSGSVPTVALLIEHGADVNVIGTDSEMIPSTPLLAAVYYYRLPQWHHLSYQWRSTDGRERSRMQALALMRMLIDNGCDVNESGADLPPLHNSAGCRDARALQLLLESGARVNGALSTSGASGDGRRARTTALAQAAAANSSAGVRLLIQHGACLDDVDRMCRDNLGQPEVPLLMRLLTRRHYDIAALLVYAGWRVSAEERSKMAAVCALIPAVCSGFGAGAGGDDESDEEESVAAAAASTLDSELLNMSARSRTRRLKLEALRWALDFLLTPHALRWRCRCAIRQSMHSGSQAHVRTLPLPVPLLNYIMFSDL